MKLAFCLFEYFPFGGLQKDFMSVLEEARKRQHEIDVYCLSWQGEKINGITIHCLPQKQFTNHGKSMAFSNALQALFKTKKYDCIIGFNKMQGLNIYFAADICLNENISWWKKLLPRYFTYLKLEKKVFGKKEKTKILALTEKQQEEYQKNYCTSSDRFFILPPILQKSFDHLPHYLQRRDHWRQELGLAPTDKMLLFVASFFKTKGLDRVLNAIAAQKSLPHLFIIGGDNPTSYLKFIEKNKLASHVHFMGAQKNLMPYYAAADIFIHPAKSEAGGKVLIEALSAGLPVLTTDVCGYSTHIKIAQAGIVLASPFKQSDCNNALTDLLHNANENFKENALNYAASHDFFGLAKHVMEYIEENFSSHA